MATEVDAASGATRRCTRRPHPEHLPERDLCHLWPPRAAARLGRRRPPARRGRLGSGTTSPFTPRRHPPVHSAQRTVGRAPQVAADGGRKPSAPHRRHRRPPTPAPTPGPASGMIAHGDRFGRRPPVRRGPRDTRHRAHVDHAALACQRLCAGLGRPAVRARVRRSLLIVSTVWALPPARGGPPAPPSRTTVPAAPWLPVGPGPAAPPPPCAHAGPAIVTVRIPAMPRTHVTAVASALH